MRISTKVLLTIALTFSGLIAVLFLVTQNVLMGSFIRLEDESARRNVERAFSALDAEVKSLNSLALDWASWDDTYRFVTDRNGNYIKSNLNTETLAKQRLNLIIYLDAAGKMVFSKAIGHEPVRVTPLPNGIYNHIAPGLPLVSQKGAVEGRRGIIIVNDEAMMFGSQPILTSEGKGPARGTLIMGRYIDDEEIKRLAATTHLPLALSLYKEEYAGRVEKEAGGEFTAKSKTITLPVSGDTISGYGAVNDIYGRPAVLIRLDLPRDIYRQGRKSLIYFISYLVLAALVSAIAIALLMKKSVMSRLAHLGGRVTDIGRSGNLSERVAIEGRDELASLAVEVNRMLESLDGLERARKDAVDELKKAHDSLEVRVKERTAELEDKNAALNEEIAERKRVEDAMREMVYHDYLTGLPNRLLVMDRLNQVIARGERHKDAVAAILFMDIDRFKVINDGLGHFAGDELIKAVAAMLQAVLRASDTVARLGGDEFTVLLQEISKPDDIQLVVQKILDLFARPVAFMGHSAFVTMSIGVSMYPIDGNDSATLLKNAEIAMYHAKGRGGGVFEMYNAEMARRSLERLKMGNELRTALEKDEFLLYYQPIYDVRTGYVAGSEALIRWQSAERGLIQPNSFIPLAEETGAIVPIGEWGLKSACAFRKKLGDMGYDSMTVSVNVSVKMFIDPGFVKMVEKALMESGLEHRHLKLEITESHLMTNIVDASKVISDLKGIGVQFSIDDFGTGYSSLGYLKDLPISQLKIDRSFVKDIETHADDRKIIVAIINLAHSINLEVVAEGVETEEQLEFLVRNGCDKIQGFLYSRPLPEDKFIALLNGHDAERMRHEASAPLPPGTPKP